MKKYQIIYADPPWKQSKGGKKAARAPSSYRKFKYCGVSISEYSSLDKIEKVSLDLNINHGIVGKYTNKYSPYLAKGNK